MYQLPEEQAILKKADEINVLNNKTQTSPL